MTIVNSRTAILFILAYFICSCEANSQKDSLKNDSSIAVYSVEKQKLVSVKKLRKTKEEWKKILTPEQYRITREEGTECAFSGKLEKNKQRGVYSCICCSTDLFLSDNKFNSGTGWPSFFQPVAKENVVMQSDYSLGMERTEVNCARCDAHLGHVFEDGPRPTGLRFCINSEALAFRSLP